MHWQNYYHQWTLPFGGFVFGFITGTLFGLLILWSLIWKGLALWKAARNGHKIWFLVLFVANTAGILEILYLYKFSKRKK